MLKLLFAKKKRVERSFRKGEKSNTTVYLLDNDTNTVKILDITNNEKVILEHCLKLNKNERKIFNLLYKIIKDGHYSDYHDMEHKIKYYGLRHRITREEEIYLIQYLKIIDKTYNTETN